MIYAQAIPQAIISMGPSSLSTSTSGSRWLYGMPPYRLWLDVELEKLAIERSMCSHSCEHVKEKDCDEKCE